MRTGRRRGPLLLAALAALLFGGGCGSASSPSSTTQPVTTTATTATAPKPPEPHAKLSAAEYAVLVRIAKQSDALDKQKGAKLVRGYARVCKSFAGAPQTPLLQAETRLCLRGKRLLVALLSFRTHERECTRAGKAGDVSCYGELYSRVARTTRVAVVSTREVNAELARRGLKGTCAKGVGSSSAKDLKNAAVIGHTARVASQAIYAHDLARYTAANNQFVKALRASDNGDKTSTVAQMRKCRHD
jgi:hypothetical protein